MAADIGGDVNEDEPRSGPHQSVGQARKPDALQNEELGDDVQESRHHQGEKINSKELFHFSYQRYLENRIREIFSLEGTPVRMIVRERGDKAD